MSAASLLRTSLAALAVSPLLACMALGDDATDFFEAKIRPVLAAECYECHSAKKQKGGLRLDWREGWKKGSDSGDAIVPGDAAKSLVIRAIRHEEPDLKMPSKAPKLDDTVIADFEKWVNLGAPDPRDTPPSDEAAKPTWADTLAARKSWWSLQPVRPANPPAVKNAGWSEHPVDRFLLAKMEEKNLAPAPDADARTLIRRLTFALTGLPPTPEEVEAFVVGSIKNRKSEIANATDRLLASPRFGEHWARHWMDLVRYADTHGSEGDPAIPEAWRYRDYLIRAFNTDVPVDRLIREHLAGDLLPDPRWNRDEQFNESILGTAHLRFVEHGFQPVDTLDEQVKVVDSQIDVAMKAFQGLTVTCARCHDHKFDAVSQRDYYALFGVFASSRPAMVTIDSTERLGKNRAELSALKSKIKSALANAWLAEAAQISERLNADGQRRERIALMERELAALEETVARRFGDEPAKVAASHRAEPIARWSFDDDARDSIGALHGHLEGGAEVRGGRLVLGGRGSFLRTEPLAQELGARTFEAWVALANSEQRGGAVLSIEGSQGQGFDAIVFGENEPAHWMAGSDSFRRTRTFNGPAETAKPGELTHIAMVYQPDGRLACYRNGVPYGTAYRPDGERTDLQRYAPGGAHVLLGLRHTGAGNGFLAGEIDEARIYDRPLTQEEIAASFRAGPTRFAELVKFLTDTERAQHCKLTESLAQERSRAATNAEWAKALTEATKSEAPSRALPAPAWNVADGDYAKCFHYGAGLGDAPARCGEFSITPEGDRVLTGLYPAGAVSHSLSRRHNGVFTTPRFKIESDFISVRAFGGGGAQMRLIVDGYPLGTGQIFPRAQLSNDEPSWITIDVKYRRRSMAYLEFATPNDLTRPENQPKDGRSWFGVERIVFHDAAGKPAADAPSLRALLGSEPPQSAEALAACCGQVLAAAIEAWRDDSLAENQRAFLDLFVRRGLLPVALPQLESVCPLIAEYRRLEDEVPIPRRAPGVFEADSYDAPFLPHGDHLKPGEPVPRAYLGVFGGAQFATHESGRRELADCLVDPHNPLTARVAANRIWQWLFGRGIVPTPDNFGRMGERPTHPELLDFLAAQFAEHGWSTKEMIRLLVTSRAFQMSSDPSPAAREHDPANEFLSHFRVRRLEAEAIRDALLAVPGNLDPAMFGPGDEANTKRRSVYLAVRRTNLNPFLGVFDAPKPFSTLGRRDSTNVPAQSLTMLNSPFVIEQAGVWAGTLMRSDPDTVEARVRSMFAKALNRPPDSAELAASLTYLDTLAVQRNLDYTKRLADPALWQDFAQSLFNLKEFIYVR